MSSTPVVPFKATLSRPIGQGEVTRRMERTTARSVPQDVPTCAKVPLPSDT